MNDDAQQKPAHGNIEPPTPAIDATIGFESTAGVPNSQKGISNATTKQENDLAFAAAVLRSGALTERLLAQSILRWTVHGDVALAQHLVDNQVITRQQCDELTAVAEQDLERVLAGMPSPDNWSETKHSRFVADNLDRAGKLSKLLGMSDASVLAADEVENRRINARYTLLRRLGQGGIGTVWLARDENLQRYVAVKEITRSAADTETAQAHFRREAEITGKLEHPGIVPIYQFGMDDATGRQFYAMRFMGKRTLQDAITEYHERREAGNEDQLLKHRLLTAFVNVCQAVAHAHTRNVIHRDLKPENVAIDAFGQIVLLDWGLAKINEETGMYEVQGRTEPGDLHNVSSTQMGRVLGTPLYMAPEQAAGRLEEVDELTDVYGLGGILYAILTGVGPHQHGIESFHGRGGAAEVFSKIVASEIQPPQEVVEDVPPELSAICLKALSSKRYLRYASATDLAEDVERYRAGAPVDAYKAPIRSRIKRWMATHPTLAQLAMLTTTLLILGGAAIGFTARQGQRALREARFEALTEFTSEIDLNLRFEVRELVQDVRFLTDFPLTLAITATQLPETATAGKINSGSAEIDLQTASPEQWIERQGRLMDGILEANPSYLVISCVHFQRPIMTEIVRSERLRTGMRPRRVPRQQLHSGDHPESDEALYALRPGEVVMTTADLLADNVPTKNRSPLVVVGICPVFDATGAFFGINVIELDLRDRLGELLAASPHNGLEVIVADTSGRVAMTWQEGNSSFPERPMKIDDELPELGNWIRDVESAGEFNHAQRVHATKVRLGPKAELTIVARMVE